MMVVLLIMTIVLAAGAPMMTTRYKKDTSNPWKWLSTGSIHAYFGDKDKQVGMIGQKHDPTGDELQAKLIINSTLTDHILFKNSDNILGRLRFTGGGILLGNSATTPNNSVSIGNSIENNSENTIAINSSGIDATTSMTIGASSPQAIAIGHSAQVGANSANAISFGQEANAVGKGSIAIGSTAKITNEANIPKYSIAIGYGSTIGPSQVGYSGHDGAVALGADTAADSIGIAIGYKANAVAKKGGWYGPIAIGYYARTRGMGVAIGRNANKEIFDTEEISESIAIGDGANAIANAVAVGPKTKGFSANAIAIGYMSEVYTSNSLAIGVMSRIWGKTGGNGVAIGMNSNVWQSGTAIGTNSIAGDSSIAIGGGKTARATCILNEEGNAYQCESLPVDKNGSNFVSGAIAMQGTCSGFGSITMKGVSTGYASISIGEYSGAVANHAVAIGRFCHSRAEDSIAIGTSANSISYEGIAIGRSASAEGVRALAIGASMGTEHATALGTDSIVLGVNAKATAENAVAIGKNAVADTANTIVLGTNSMTVKIPGGLHVDGSLGGSLAVISDRRLKNVGKEFTSGLDKIRELKVFNFTYKDDKTKTPRVGVIAQDLQKVFPNAVRKDSKGYLSVRMEDMFYAVINAIKELDTKFNALRKENEQLKKRCNDLEKRLEALEQKIK